MIHMLAATCYIYLCKIEWHKKSKITIVESQIHLVDELINLLIKVLYVV